MATPSMDVDYDPNVKTEKSGNYTILRIKRKRTDEPLDALVIDAKVRRKKSRPGLEFFRFVQTVEQDAWTDEQRTRDLQDRIAALRREPLKPLADEKPQRQIRADAVPLHYKVIPREVDVATDARGSPKLSTPNEQAQPKIRDFRMFDAVPMAQESIPPQLVDDPEMANFLPLLQDYLKINDINPAAEAAIAAPTLSSPPRVVSDIAQLSHSPSPGEPVLINAPAPPPPSDDPDYVWDVFYHLANVDGYEELPNANIATLTGLPASFNDPYSSEEESENEDEADEDSNAEEYYKNDYPDEDSGSDWDDDSEDMFHERSDREGAFRDHGDDAADDW